MNARLEVALRSVSVRRGRAWALREVSWRLRAGERWALLGENGAGKTQLLKVLSGDVWPTPTARDPRERGRSFYLAGRELELIDAKPYLAYLGAEAQDKYARHGWNLTVKDLVATGLHGTDILLNPIARAERARIGQVLKRCRIARLAARPFLTLSYGERRLALLARALVRQPHWLLLDELYNGLDAQYRRRIDAVLAAAARRGQSWVVTAHRAADVPAATTHVLFLHSGRVRESRAFRGADRARLGDAQRPSMAGGRGPRTRPPLLKLRGVDLYVEYREVLRQVDWQVCRGEHWAVFGNNGAGKSCLLKLLYGDLQPAQGGLLERAGFPKGTPIADWKRQVALVSPELQTAYLIKVPLLELVASGAHGSIGLAEPCSTREARRARGWLKFFRLTSQARATPAELSYGQLRRALIARAMMAAPKILLLDEPLTGLDARQRVVMKRLLRRLMKKNVTVIAAVHHIEDLPDGMTHQLRLHKRRAIAGEFQSAT